MEDPAGRCAFPGGHPDPDLGHLLHGTDLLQLLEQLRQLARPQTELSGRPPAHFRLNFFAQIRKNCKTYFFELLLGMLCHLRETWPVHSPHGPNLKLSKEFCPLKKCANY